MVLIVTLSSTVLAFALYATLNAVNRLLAQLALIFSLGDSFLAMVVRMCSFVRGSSMSGMLTLVLRHLAAEILTRARPNTAHDLTQS
jgi:hypothetical protein